MATKQTEDAEVTTEETAKKKPARKTAAKAPKKKDEAADEAKMEKMDAEEMEAGKAAKGGSFIPAVGRRKTSIARVRLIKNGKGTITVNGQSFEKYFHTFDLREQVINPLRITGQETAVDVSAKVEGGGVRGQAEAVRHGLSRALIELNPTFRKTLKKLGYLTRDPREKERKKFGLKGARRSPQWSKR
jgi:small subunit ribosomal protein S9